MKTSATRLSAIAGLCSLIILSGCASLLAPTVATGVSALRAGEYALDQSHAALIFKIKHFGLSNYVGRFNRFDASLEFDPEDIEQANLEAVIEMDSLDINNPALRDDLLGAKWFDQANYPQARLTTTSVRRLEDNQFELLANLEWRGVTKAITLMVDFNGGARNSLTGKYTVGFSAKTSFLRSDFGVKRFLPIVGDRVEIEVYVEFQKA